MIRAAVLMALMAAPAFAAGPAEQAQQAAATLRKAVSDMQSAREGRDRVAALTRTIGAYEDGLAALRESLRQVAAREADLRAQQDARRADLGHILGALARMESDPGPMLMLHPGGPLATVRTGMILADVGPALQAEADGIESRLSELRQLAEVQRGTAGTLAEGLRVAQDARAALGQAISDRTDLPRRFTDDPSVLRAILESSDTLDAFAGGLDPDGMPPGFADLKGSLPLPAHATLVRKADAPDAAGVRRPGIILATAPGALVTAPMAATIRYRGPLTNYGNVMILEPGSGYLMVIAGLETLYGEVGEVVPAGAALGLMPGGDQALVDFLGRAGTPPGAGGTETLYVELRQGSGPVDPAQWFAATER
ncbi:murein hydrolase activator EnvC family protein [Falsirhodobacter halotolerans]|uniref:murein hydrolase activator EnvC family protein n=1 Tax=Falsirhodobacter halotolerans TaxID=1146892 RepID=UPI001FD0B00C|nr:peptidoglycan DD-metalloendopeptidase family protein [Falsirhodobacter halotolerans]MCJ8138380.1 peptidoglycan DD-metalloendopeptidase family protein [Falsirhodobacter halotolerans]